MKIFNALLIHLEQLGSKICICLVTILSLVSCAKAISATAIEYQTHPHIEVALLSDRTTVKLNETFLLGVHLVPEKHWHTYWRNPGDSGAATTIDISSESQIEVGEIQWPLPQRVPMGPIVNFGYEKDVLLMVPITIKDSASDRVDIRAAVSWLVCEEICIPGSSELQLTLKLEDKAEQSSHRGLFERFQAKVPKAIEKVPTLFLTENELNIQLPGTSLKSVDDMEFFPITEQVIRNGSNAKLAPINQVWHGKFPLDSLASLGKSFSGVLVIDEIYALRFDAPILSSPPKGQAHGVTQVPVLSTWLALLFAFLGGIILNAMPCVFPVLSLKALSLSKSTDTKTASEFVVPYVLGVLLCFTSFAVIIWLLKLFGLNAGWGFQLQQAWFVALLGILFFFMGLALLGWYVPGGSLMGLGESLANQGGRRGAFFSGLLAVIVASPCTAPFMAPALGATLGKDLLDSLPIYISLGLGFALPLVAVISIPAVRRKLPRPGPWMNTFKEFLAFPMLLASVWLFWVLNNLTDSNTLAATFIAILSLCFAIWIKDKLQGLGKYISITFLLAFPIWQIYQLAQSPDDTKELAALSSVPYSPKALEKARKEGWVFVNMTADWCVTCKFNELTVLTSESVHQLFAKHRVTYMVGDWTEKNAEILAFLESHGRTGVPLYLLYRGQNPPTVLPQILTFDTIKSHFSTLEKEQGNAK